MQRWFMLSSIPVQRFLIWGGGSGVSVLELVENFERANDIKIPYVFTERREGDIAECWQILLKLKSFWGGLQSLAWRICAGIHGIGKGKIPTDMMNRCYTG